MALAPSFCFFRVLIQNRPLEHKSVMRLKGNLLTLRAARHAASPSETEYYGKFHTAAYLPARQCNIGTHPPRQGAIHLRQSRGLPRALCLSAHQVTQMAVSQRHFSNVVSAHQVAQIAVNQRYFSNVVSVHQVTQMAVNQRYFSNVVSAHQVAQIADFACREARCSRKPLTFERSELSGVGI